MYRARKTLVIQFTSDTLDESLSVERTLKEANTIMRMKRPMVDMDVQLLTLQGTHLTPLLQAPARSTMRGMAPALQGVAKEVRQVLRRGRREEAQRGGVELVQQITSYLQL
jgi:hypothetical protein